MRNGSVYSKQYDLNEFLLIKKMRENGSTFKEISNKVSFSVSGACSVYHKGIRPLYKKLKGSRDKDGYIEYKLRKKDGSPKYIRGHRIVGFCYLNLKENKQINHKNGVKDDNKVQNLECVTQAENMLHSAHVLGNSYIDNLPDNKKPVKVSTKDWVKTYPSIKEMSRNHEDIKYGYIVKLLKQQKGEISYKKYKIKLLIN